MTKPGQPWFIRRAMPQEIHRIHLIGIAGSGMGAFACMLKEAGYEVRGSDQNVYPPMSDILSGRGIEWMESWDPVHLDWAPDLVVVGNVCRRDNPEAVAAEARGIPSVSFPQALGDLFLARHTPVVITGTHGKTTTTALTTWLLHSVGLRPGMLVGGRARNFNATYLLGGDAGSPFVVEGDEYDTAYFDKGPKFLHYRAKIAVLNNVEFDHADIYDDLDEIIQNFERLTSRLGSETTLFVNGDDPIALRCAGLSLGEVITYGFSEGCDLRASRVEPGPSGCHFTLHLPDGSNLSVHSALAGRHNVWNALAAIGVCMRLDVAPQDAISALQTFSGTHQRQEELGEPGGILVISDYAHHPTAIRETLAALRARYPGRRLWGVYEPKSNTARRNIHQEAYVEAFVQADEVVLAKPFFKADGLAPDALLDVEKLAQDIGARGPSVAYHPTVDDILKHLVDETRAGDVVVIMANSGFGGLTGKLLEALGS